MKCKAKSKAKKSKPRPKKPSVYYSLEVTYPAERYGWDTDWPIIKAIGEKYESGSGMGMGGRDIGFVFKSEKALLAAKKRLAKLKRKYRWLKSSVSEEQHED
jgi:hypothetical protein